MNIENTKEKEEEEKSKIGYKEVFAFCMHYWKRRAGMGIALVALMVVAVVADVFVPVYVGKIVDALDGRVAGDVEAFGRAFSFLGVFAVLLFVYYIFRWMAMSLWVVFTGRCVSEMTTDAMRKVQLFSSAWHANSFAGATVRKINRGVSAYELFSDILFMSIMTSAVVVAGMSIMLLIKLPLVGVFAVVFSLVYVSVIIWMTLKWEFPLTRKAADHDTKVGAALADIVTGNPTVKAFGMEGVEYNKFKRIVEKWRQVSQKAWLSWAFMDFVGGIFRGVLFCGILGFSVLMWYRGVAGSGDVAMAFTATFIVSGYLRGIGESVSKIHRSVSDMVDIVYFWKSDVAVRDIPGAKPLLPRGGEIVFDNVRFSYGDSGSPVYEGLSVHIKAGEKVALVGVSGSGKSTFVKLLQRLYDVQGGRILIDGQDISKVTQESVRRATALVPQDPVLFHRSLAENIAYARPDASMAEIVDAARKAYAHDFIAGLKDGYDTMVGERGIKLSGGERQRVAIARAILADCPIMILDEATSSLDSVSEHYIQKALKNLMEGRTSVTIAHRLSTIKNVDRILVFENGRIVEQGTHDGLLANEESLYKRLYDMQVMGLV